MRALLFVTALLLSSCVTYTKCVDKYGTVLPGLKVPYTDTLRGHVLAPADSAEGSIDLDTLCADWAALKLRHDRLKGAYDSLLTTSGSKELTVAHWIDEYNRLLRFKSKVVHDSIPYERIVRDSVNCPEQVVMDPSKDVPAWRKLWEQFQFFAAWVLLGGLFLMLMNKLFR